MLLQHHVAALGAQGDLDSIGQLVNAGFQSLAGFVIAVENCFAIIIYLLQDH